NQEKLIQQLKSGVHALQTPVDTLVSNWAFMVMASLAWSLRAWFALLIPETGRWRDRRAQEKRELLRMEFKRFVNAIIRVPVQVVRSGRCLVYRFLAWRPWAGVVARASELLRVRPRLC
ncbi:MAG: IS1380 family transposase, partial [Planctomycetes bacterium]|nr:IS1380 family transposase [Planctomycetota bacterium]